MSNLIRACIAYSNAILAIGKEHEEAINKIAKSIKDASEVGKTAVNIPVPKNLDSIILYLEHFGYKFMLLDEELLIDWSNPPKPC